MAFSATARGSGPWASLPPALMTMPELLLARAGDRHLLDALRDGRPRRRPGRDPRAASRPGSASLRDAPLPPLDPSPTEPATVASVRPPASYEAAVAARRRADPRR